LLAEKYILKDTVIYKKLSSFFMLLDNFFKLKPLRWFAVWAMIVSGCNAAIHLESRWMYWSWDSFSLYLFFAFVLSSFIDFIFITKLSNRNGKSFYIEQLIIILYGFFLFSLGSNPLNLSLNLLLVGFPYILFFYIGHLTWKIPLKIFRSSKPNKKDFAPLLLITIIFTFIASMAGYLNDDPMISTIAAVYLPFPLVAIVFPPGIRHLQRCRMYVIFIPLMFLSMRHPWLILITGPLFLLSRYYFYFTHGNVIPTFKVDQPD
tara:strand:+ start:305 stop:1090 length:786 start_codon:yes stop_codon:yes gene_type:complete